MSKTSNVYARIEPETKEQAEAILSKLGIPSSVAINMFYNQIILNNGLPFDVKIPSNKILNEDYILTSDDVDDDGIMQIVNLYTLLDKANINCYLYDDNDRIGIEILNNLLSMYNEINEKVNREMEEEAKKEGE